MLDDSLKLNQFIIVPPTNESQFSSLKHFRTLEPSLKGKDFLRDHSLYLADHARTMITANNNFHFKRWSVKFIPEGDQLQSQAQRQQEKMIEPKYEILLEEQKGYKQEHFQQGPIPVGKTGDCLGYFYQKDTLEEKDQELTADNLTKIEHYCYLTQGTDSKLNLLIEGSVPFCTFIKTIRNKDEKEVPEEQLILA